MIVRDEFEKWAWNSGSSLDLSKKADGTYKSKETDSAFNSFVGALKLAVKSVNDLWLYYVDGSPAAKYTARVKETLISEFGLDEEVK